MKSNIKETFDDLFKRDMDRKEFLASLGAMILALVGISNLISLISGQKKFHQGGRLRGFGSGPYGGKEV